jgi:tetratricopeptide (TPR) repeat protein
MSNESDPYAELRAAYSMPRGIARSSMIESVVERADAAGDESLAWDARLLLVNSYSLGGEPLKRFAPFARLLQRYDADPAAIDVDSRNELFWHFKGVTVGALSHPGVTRQQIETGLVDMEERYRAAGEGMAPVLGVRYQVEAHIHGEEAAEEAYLAWTRAPRTLLSDCEGCEPTERVAYLVARGRYADAVSEAAVVLDRESDVCVEQPQQMISWAMEPLLRTGDPVRAAREHLRAVRRLRSVPGDLEHWGQHVLICARSGRLVRGLDLLEERLHEIDHPPAPDEAMWLAAAGARLLTGLIEAGHADLSVQARNGGEPSGTVAEVVADLTGRARGLAAQFDARNGTATVGNRVEQWLAASELPDLPLDEVDAQGRIAVVRGRVPDPVLPPAPAPAPVEFEAVFAAYRSARDSGSRARRAVALQAWTNLRPTVPPDADPVAVARLDAALAMEDVQSDREDLPRLAQAALTLRAAGDLAGALQYELVCLGRGLETGAITATDGQAQLTALLAQAQECEPVERGPLMLGALPVLAALDPERDVRAEQDVLLAQGLELLGQADALTPYQRACQALLMLYRSLGLEPEQRLSMMRAALDLIPVGERAHERAMIGVRLGSHLAESGDLDAAVDVLEPAVVDADVTGAAPLAAEAWMLLGRIRDHIGDQPGAVEAFTRAIGLLGADSAPMRLAGLRQDLVHALRAEGRSLEAAELAEAGLHALTEFASGQGISPDMESEPATSDVRRQLGTLAFAAALAALDLAEQAHAADLARRSAGWHASIGWGLAEAEALSLAARAEEDPAEMLRMLRRAAELFAEGGHWQAAARSRRTALGLTLEVEGPEAVGLRLGEARAALHAVTPEEEAQERGRAWEHLALTEQSAQLLAAGSKLDEALAALEGLDTAYLDLGDQGSVGDVAVLRADVLIDLGRADEGLAGLQAVLQVAVDAADAQEMRRLGGQLARMLDQVGRPDDAEEAWERYCGPASSE